MDQPLPRNYGTLPSGELPPQSAEGTHSTKEKIPTSTGGMLREIFKIAMPSMLTLVLIFGGQTISLAYVGRRLGSEALAGYSVGMMVNNVLGLAPAMGFAGAVDTLASQAFGRNPNTRTLNTLFQRAMLINTLLLVPLTMFCWCSGPLLKLLFGTTLTAASMEFLVLAPVYLFLALFEDTLSRILIAQHLATLPMYGNVLGLLCTVGLYQFYLPEGGTVTRAVLLLCGVEVGITALLVGAALCHPRSLLTRIFIPQPGIIGKKALKQYCKLGTGALAETILLWWAFELLQVFCARLGDIDVAAYGVAFDLINVFFSISAGIGEAACTLVGNCLGANNPELAKAYALMTFQLAVASVALTTSALLLLGDKICELFTSDPRLLNALIPVIPALVLLHITDGTQAILVCIFDGAGQQQSTAIAASAVWLVGLPLAAASLKTNLGLSGVVGGLSVGLLLISPVLGFKLLRWDWKALALEAAKEDDEGEDEDAELLPV